MRPPDKTGPDPIMEPFLEQLYFYVIYFGLLAFWILKIFTETT